MFQLKFYRFKLIFHIIVYCNWHHTLWYTLTVEYLIRKLNIHIIFSTKEKDLPLFAIWDSEQTDKNLDGRS